MMIVLQIVIVKFFTMTFPILQIAIEKIIHIYIWVFWHVYCDCRSVHDIFF